MLGVGSYEQTMRIYCACIVVAITAALFSCENNKPKTDELSVELDNLSSMAERTAKRGEMRQFLWSHWTERRPANLFLTGVSKEGEVTHSEYRIWVSRWR